MTKCSECGFYYVPEFEEDAKAHQIHHDKKVNGIHYRSAKTENMIWQSNEFRITVVNFFSHLSQKVRAQEVGLLAWDDTDFSFGRYHSKEMLDDRDIHNFLLYRRNRVIGLLIAEKRSYADIFTWAEYEIAGGQELTERPHIWSIGYVWILKKHRKQGLSRKLVVESVTYLGVNLDAIGWHPPFTKTGKALVESLCPDRFWVAM